MNKLLLLLCFALLPLPAFALLENATVSTEVLPNASDKQLAQHNAMMAKLNALIEKQLTKIPDLNGSYIGMVRGQMPEADTQERSAELQAEFFRIAPLSKGKNRLWVGDKEGAFKVEATFEPSGRHWSLEGLVEYRTYAEPQKISNINTSATVSKKLTILAGMSGEQVRKIAQKDKKSIAGEPAQEQRAINFVGFFVLRTDAPDSPDTVYQVELPEGGIVFKPEISPAEVQAAIEKMIADEIAVREAAAANDKPAAK